MRNYIPNDFYSKGKSTVYSRKEDCLEKEGSAIEFDPNTINLSECSIADNEIVFDQEKSTTYHALRKSAESTLNKRRAYRKADHLLLEALAEKEEGRPEKMQEYLAKRSEIKDSFPEG